MAQESWKREQEAGCQQPDGPVLCAKNCGFFGSGATMNMCSKCYREHVLKQTQEAAKVNAATAAAVVVAAAKASSPQVTAPAQGHGVMPDPMDVDSSSGLKEASGDGVQGSPITSSLVERPSPSQPSTQALPSVGGASRPVSGLAPGALAPAIVTPAAKAVGPTLEEALTAVAASGPASSSTGPNRCAHCKKKVGLTGFKCRCNGVYCSAHRYSDKHNCSFDYKAAARSAIAKANPVVRADKIEKI